MKPLDRLPPIARRLVTDRTLPPRALNVWLLASDQLEEFPVFTELKVRGLAEALGVSPSVVSGILQALAKRGLLLREEGAPSRASARYALPSDDLPTPPNALPVAELPRARRTVISTAAAQRLRELG